MYGYPYLDLHLLNDGSAYLTPEQKKQNEERLKPIIEKHKKEAEEWDKHLKEIAEEEKNYYKNALKYYPQFNNDIDL